MNIMYCGDKGTERGVLISILSLLMRGPRENIYNIYILTITYGDVVPFGKKAAKLLDELVKKYNPESSVEVVDATKAFLQKIPEKNMDSYFTACSMLRLYADRVPELEKCDRILYMDYDVVCRGDISEFYNTDLTGVEVAGVLDIYGRRIYHYNGFSLQDYMNSGVMLFNMVECRKNHVFEKAVDLCAKRRMLLADQAALNKAILRRKLMPRRYNEQGERPRKDTVLHHFSNNFKFFPVVRVQKVKPFDIERVHSVLKITEYDDIFEEYEKLRGKL